MGWRTEGIVWLYAVAEKVEYSKYLFLLAFYAKGE
jgi:hypothetical protein